LSALREFSRSLPMALLRAREAVMNRFRPTLRRYGVTEQQWRVLRALSTAAEASASSLATATCIGLPSLSRILRTLEGRGLIARRVKTTDLRTTLVSLTAAGRRLLGKAGVESEQGYEALAEEIGWENLQQLYALLERVSATRGGNRQRPGRRPGPASSGSRRRE
jgi:homoprotocatechuate degradation regulator HpaR